MLDSQSGKQRGTPLTFGEIVRQTLAIYKTHFITLLIFSVIVAIPLTLLSSYLLTPALARLSDLQQSVVSSSDALSGSVDPSLLSQLGNDLGGILASVGMVLVAISFVQTIILNSAVTQIASEQYFGKRISIVQAFLTISPRLPILGVSSLLAYSVIVVVSVAMAAILFACGMGFGLIVYVALTLQSLLVPVAILERQNILGSLGRSFTLGKLHLWQIVRATILFMAFVQIAEVVFAPLIDSLAGGTGIVVAVIVLLIQAAIAPLFPIAMTLLYYDARNRYEGLEAQLSASELANARPADVASPTASALITNRDISNIVLVSLLTLAMFFALIALQMLFVG
ncbi:MAG: hypothetical protein KF726_18810 [Anaerolineae bacterium]|nr:hypothetical protein [Anaerolineae bacterium]